MLQFCAVIAKEEGNAGADLRDHALVDGIYSDFIVVAYYCAQSRDSRYDGLDD